MNPSMALPPISSSCAREAFGSWDGIDFAYPNLGQADEHRNGSCHGLVDRILFPGIYVGQMLCGKLAKDSASTKYFICTCGFLLSAPRYRRMSATIDKMRRRVCEHGRRIQLHRKNHRRTHSVAILKRLLHIRTSKERARLLRRYVHPCFLFSVFRGLRVMNWPLFG